MPSEQTEAASGRILAVDWGERRVGLAVSDEGRTFAFGLKTLVVELPKKTPKQQQRDSNKPNAPKPNPAVLQQLAALCAEQAVCEIVLGLPVNMDGSEGPMAQQVRQFGNALAETTQLPVAYWDERLTSTLAQNTLRELGISPSRNKEKVDEAAAVRILQDYLDHAKKNF